MKNQSTTSNLSSTKKKLYQCAQKFSPALMHLMGCWNYSDTSKMIWKCQHSHIWQITSTITPIWWSKVGFTLFTWTSLHCTSQGLSVMALLCCWDFLKSCPSIYPRRPMWSGQYCTFLGKWWWGYHKRSTSSWSPLLHSQSQYLFIKFQ